MSERPIEEVIGWTKRPDTRRGRRIKVVHPGWLDASGKWHHHAEVDDLALWLREHDAGHAVILDAVTQYLYVEVRSIREALIAAVREVAGE